MNFFYSLLILGLTVIISSCQSPREQALEDIERVRGEMLKDSTQAMPSLQSINNTIAAYTHFYTEFEQDSLAPNAMFQAASLYRLKRDFNAAIKLWEDIQEDHPNSMQASQSLFLKAFTYENELKNLGKAKQFYSEFLRKYPDHELASSAEFSLKYLGKPAEDILKDFEQKNNPADTTVSGL